MIPSITTLEKAVATARNDLTERQEKIVALDGELKALRLEHEAAERKAKEAAEIDRQVQGVLRKLLGDALKGFGQKEETFDEKAAKRIARIEAISRNLEQLEIEEELLLRALEEPGLTLLPRRAKVDVTVVAAPLRELVAAHEQLLSGSEVQKRGRAA